MGKKKPTEKNKGKKEGKVFISHSHTFSSPNASPCFILPFFNFVLHFSSLILYLWIYKSQSLMTVTYQNWAKTNKINNKILYSNRNSNASVKLDIF